MLQIFYELRKQINKAINLFTLLHNFKCFKTVTVYRYISKYGLQTNLS